MNKYIKLIELHLCNDVTLFKTLYLQTVSSYSRNITKDGKNVFLLMKMVGRCANVSIDYICKNQVKFEILHLYFLQRDILSWLAETAKLCNCSKVA